MGTPPGSPPDPPVGPRLRRWQNAAAVALLCAPLAFLAYQAFASASAPLLLHDSRAAWIAYPREMTTDVFKYPVGSPPANRFTRTFTLDAVPGRAILHVKALRELTLFINGAEIPAEEVGPVGFRSPAAIDVAAYLRPGENTLRADVRNPLGPGLLCLWVEGLPEPLATDESWTAATPARPPVPAVVADGTRPHPDSFLLPTPAQCLWGKRGTVAALFAVSCGLFLLGRRLGPRAFALLPKAALALITLAWVYLFLVKFRRIPVGVGFDAFGHVQVIEHLIRHHSLPRPDELWSSYHPPLFYALAAGLWHLVSSFWPAGGSLALKLVPFLSGLGNVWAAHGLARRVFPDSPGRVLAAVLVAGTLPMNVYLSAYVSNESLHACLASFAILGTAALLARPAVGWRGVALAGALFGLAALTKFTAFPLLGLAAGFLAWKLFVAERRPPLRAAALVAVFLLAVAAVSGWHYARNLAEYGRPAVTNFTSFGGQTWWQQPGFRTPAYYGRFGESLRHPYFSAYASFGDSVYSTLWGDGLVGGLNSVAGRHRAWNDDWMSAGYLLALPLTGLMAFGFLCLAGRAWREKDAGRQLVLYFLLAVVWCLAGLLAYYSLAVPAYSAAKAFYALSATAPLAVL
ncbi:MAG TPA: hypothetical protein VFA26_05470, partial [Gemmataceae bacterium]|nr:hypothetical protein [Gemmataceae bacterium]